MSVLDLLRTAVWRECPSSKYHVFNNVADLLGSLPRASRNFRLLKTDSMKWFDEAAAGDSDEFGVSTVSSGGVGKVSFPVDMFEVTSGQRLEYIIVFRRPKTHSHYAGANFADISALLSMESDHPLSREFAIGVDGGLYFRKIVPVNSDWEESFSLVTLILGDSRVVLFIRQFDDSLGLTELFCFLTHESFCHLGCDETKGLDKADVWWPKMRKIVKHYVKSCAVFDRTRKECSVGAYAARRSNLSFPTGSRLSPSIISVRAMAPARLVSSMT